MKAAQITGYSKDIEIMINDVPIPEIGDDEVSRDGLMKNGDSRAAFVTVRMSRNMDGSQNFSPVILSYIST